MRELGGLTENSHLKWLKTDLFLCETHSQNMYLNPMKQL